MGDSPYRGVRPPESRGVAMYDVIAPAPGEKLDVTILSHGILGVSCHWHFDDVKKGHRTIPCARPERCVGCEKAERKVWLGFVAIYNHKDRLRQVLRVGPETAKKLAERHCSIFGLSGQRLNLWRPADQRTAQLVIEESSLPRMHPVLGAHPLTRSICVVLGVDRLPVEVADQADRDERGLS